MICLLKGSLSSLVGNISTDSLKNVQGAHLIAGMLKLS